MLFLAPESDTEATVQWFETLLAEEPPLAAINGLAFSHAVEPRREGKRLAPQRGPPYQGFP